MFEDPRVPLVNVGLGLFLVVTGFNVFGLSLDYFLWLAGYPTFTETARHYPFLGVGIVLLNLMGVAGLCMHFRVAG